MGLQNSRRDVLRAVAGVGFVGAGALGPASTGRVRADAGDRPDTTWHESDPTRHGSDPTRHRFDPTRHGFGFRNWSSRTQPFESPVDEDPDREGVRATIREDWRGGAGSILDLSPDRFPDALVDALSIQLRETVVRRSGTNGHCYGMVLAAQRYHEDPAAIPIDRESASAITHPTEPLDDPSGPVYRDIVTLQSAQFLRFSPWLGRRAMLWPDRIDVAAQLRDVRAVVDAYGSAAVTLFDDQRSGHQVLASDYEGTDGDDEQALSIYDPNLAAPVHGISPRRLVFESTADGLAMRPYGRYTRLLFNRYDRIGAATDRVAGPLDHLDLSVEQVRASLFPMALATVEADDPDAVDLVVAGPDGDRLDRRHGVYDDRRRGRFPRLRFAHGPRAGRYRVAVFGRDAADYRLRVRVAGLDGARLDDVHEGHLTAGDADEFVATVPDSADEAGSLERADDGGSGGIIGATAAGAVAGGAVVAGGYHLWRRADRDREG